MVVPADRCAAHSRFTSAPLASTGLVLRAVPSAGVVAIHFRSVRPFILVGNALRNPELEAAMRMNEVVRMLCGGAIVYVVMAACSGGNDSPRTAGTPSQAGGGGGAGGATSQAGNLGSGGLTSQGGNIGAGGMPAQGGNIGVGGVPSNLDGAVYADVGAGGRSLIDVLTDPVPEASAGPIQSGTRLKAKYYAGSDGSRSPLLTWYDSQRAEDCNWMVATDGVNRCLPTSYAMVVSGSSFYADASCTLVVASVTTTCSASIPKYVMETGTAGCNGYRMFQIGAQFTGPSVYLKSGTTCMAVAVTVGTAYYGFGPEVPASSFVSATIQNEP